MPASNSRRLFAVLAVPVAFFGGVLAVAVYSFSGDPCENTFESEALSPDGTQKVVVFARSCGATTGFSIQASILPRTGSLSNEAGNVFVADGLSPHSQAIHATWLSPSEVRISYPASARVFKAAALVGQISITFVQVSNGDG